VALLTRVLLKLPSLRRQQTFLIFCVHDKVSDATMGVQNNLIEVVLQASLPGSTADLACSAWTGLQ